MGVRIVIAVAGALSVIFASTRAHTSGWYVDASVARSGDGKSWQTAFKAIQEGINAASAGDTVTVAAGTYLTNIRFNGKNIVLRSRQPSNPDAVADTIIDGGRYGPVVKFSGGEDPTCVLSGFTIRNGSADNGGGICGGTPGQPTHATISDNVITDNRAVAVWPDGQGGGVAYCDGLVERNRIVANLARHGGGLSRCNGTIRNNVIVGNSAEQNGGGLQLCGGTVELNTIARNFASLGGGLDSCRGVIRNCIICGNGGGSQLCDCSVPDYSCIGSWTGGGTGNLTYHPYFVDAARGDYHLTSWSPCIDAGDPDSPFSEEPSPNGGRVNMGAYGNTSEATCASPDLDSDGLPDAWELKHFGNLAEDPSGDPDGDGIATLDEYLRGLDPKSSAITWYVDAFAGSSGDGSSWETAFCSIEEGVDAAAHGDTIIVSPGRYIENLFVTGKNLLLQSTDPLDAAVVANTVIDGGFAGSVVVFDGNEDERCVLAGFTIRNGQAFYGGGIRGEGTRAAIRNNIITNNSAEWHGGGVSGCEGILENNTISGNGAFEGAGLAYCSGTIRDNIITGNTADGDGGGLYGCSGTFERNAVSVNAAIGGGGLAACEGVFRFNTISDNSAAENGGAFAWCSGTFANNVIWENAAAGEGGGFFDCDGTFQNNTVVWNSAQLGGGLSECYGTILNCIVWGNYGEPQLYLCDTPAYCCLEDWSGGGEGNINYNPYFVDEQNGDFHLKPRSPCVDAGDPESLFSNEPLPNGGRIDLGAYGNTSEATPKSPDTDGDGLPDDWEMDWFGDLSQDGDDDPDSDGIPNLTEYYYAWNPDAKPHSVVRNITQGRWHETIQAALAAAGDGDELVVYPGHYVENICFDGKNVILSSLDPQDSVIVADTIIDGNQSGSVVTFAGAENESCVLAGLTIANGKAGYGGGILGGTPSIHTHATIRNNRITENSAFMGGGIALCDGAIQGNHVFQNTADYLMGGGLLSCNGTVELNLISGNRAASPGGGLADCSGIIRGNLILGNSAAYGGGLGGGAGIMQNNLIANNIAESNGGGVNCYLGTMENNTIVGNSAEYGGGLEQCTGTIRNCIVWGNEATEGSQVYNSADPTYSCIEGWAGAGQGNIPYYPYFVDAQGGDYHLRSYSPCIDAGDPASDFSSEPQPNGGRIDMGAYGNTPEATCASPDNDGDGLPDDWEKEFFGDLAQGPDDDPDEDGLSNLEEYRQCTDPTAVVAWYVDASVAVSGSGASWSKAFRTIQQGINAASEGQHVFVAPGTYFENIRFNGKNIILTSTDPLDPSVIATTIIDGQQLDSVVTFVGTETEACLLAGFTIRNGRSAYGGGVWGSTTYAAGSRATIRNNFIINNSALHFGGGLAYCDGLIQNNTIAGNVSETYGGGLSWCGGTIEANYISENSAYSYGGGLDECNGTVRGNIVVRNYATVAGGGLRDCYGTIENNTIVRNSAAGGAGLTWCKGTIRNCIVWENACSSGPQVAYSSRPTYSCIQDWAEGGVGNISAFPHFADLEGGDYHLQSWSPCIDAGHPASDFLNEPQPNGGRINMGAYGNTPDAACASPDTDADELPDDWEMHFFGNLARGASDDPDSDGMSNLEEYHRGTNPAQLATWYVDGSVPVSGDGKSWETAFRTVQQGIGAVSDGGVVVVAEGIYLENVHFNGKNITLASTDPLDPVIVANTIIDGGSAGPVVRFLGTEGQTCIISGFTIRNGSAPIGGGICGGVQHSHTQATIQNNVITGNSARYNGGGLAYCDGVVQNNTIRGNAADDQGGGAASSGGTVQNNIIEGNTAGGDAGALYDCDGTIQGNRIAGNSCEYGGVLFLCDGLIRNNAISGNFSAHESAGLYSCDGIIENNVVTGNSGVNSGGGLAYCQGVIRNCIIWGNLPLPLPQVYASSDPSYSCIQNWTEGGEGNISTYPYFVNPDEGDYHLATASSCIDAGKNDDWMWQAGDLDGTPRIIHGGSSLTVDMGAYEFGYPLRTLQVRRDDSGGVLLIWSSRPADAYYVVWSCLDLFTGEWTQGNAIAPHGKTTTWYDPDTTSRQKFYRIEIIGDM